MIWAMLAAFLTRKPPLVQALVVGLCCGLFVATNAQANERSPRISSTLVLIVVVGLATGGLFFLGLRTSSATEADLPSWVVSVYVMVWLLSLAAAVRALLGDGGFKVAALAIVPIVLLAPTALDGLRTLFRPRHAR